MPNKKEKSLKEEILSTDILDKVENKVNKVYKVAEPVGPKNIPDFPDDVTSLSSEEVGKFLSCYDAEVAYIRYLLAKVEIQASNGRYILDNFKKRMYLGMRSEMNTHDSQAWTDIDLNVVNAEKALREIESERMLLQSRLDIFTKYSASISREISRRKGEDWAEKVRVDPIVNTKQVDRVNKIKGKEFTPKIKE